MQAIYVSIAGLPLDVLRESINVSIHACTVSMHGHVHTHRDMRIGKSFQYTINMGICISHIIGTGIDASHREVVDCLLKLSASAPQPFSACTQGTVHQAQAGEAVVTPQAGSSPHHLSTGLVGIPKKPRACSTSSSRS